MATEKVTYELSLRDLMTKGLNDINAKMGKLEANLGNTQKQANKTEGAFKSLAGALSLVAVGAFIKDTVLVTAKFQSMGNAIRFASDNAVQGGLSMNWLSDFSKEWGLNLESTAEGFKTFQGAMMKTKFTSNEVRKMFSQVSMGVVAMGLDAEQAKGAFLALGQMQSKGKISAEELRGQLGERLPGAMAIMARAVGVTVSDLDDLMKKGKLLSEEVLPKFAAEMEKTFSSGAVDNTNSMNANINRLTNSWLELQVAMGESQGGVINTTMKAWSIWLDTIANQFRDINQLSAKASNQNTMNILGNMEGLIKGKSTDLSKKGASKEQIEKELTATVGQAQSSWGIQQMRLREQIKGIEGKKINISEANTAENLLGITDYYRSKEGLYKGDKEYKKLVDELTSLETASKGLQGIADKEISSLYAPTKTAEAEKEKLQKQSESVSGGVPKVVNINIEALMKEVQVYLGSGDMNTAPANDFLDKLSRALNTVVEDVGIVAQYGR